MTTQKFLISLLFVLILGIPGFAASAQAETLEIQGMTVTSCNDPVGKFSFTAHVIVRNSNGFVVNAIPQSIGVDVQVTTNWHDEFFTSVISAEAMLSISVETPNAIDFGRVRVTLQDNPSLSQTIYVTCDSVKPDKPDVSTPVLGRDGRLNFGHGDLVSALYLASDTTSRPAISVYDINGEGKGVLAGLFTRADYSAYLDAPPVKNVKVATVGNCTLYALTTGEFQINIGPDREGKVVRVVMDSIPPTKVQFR